MFVDHGGRDRFISIRSVGGDTVDPDRMQAWRRRAFVGTRVDNRTAHQLRSRGSAAG